MCTNLCVQSQTLIGWCPFGLLGAFILVSLYPTPGNFTKMIREMARRTSGFSTPMLFGPLIRSFKPNKTLLAWKWKVNFYFDPKFSDIIGNEMKGKSFFLIMSSFYFVEGINRQEWIDDTEIRKNKHFFQIICNF
jgi:hypothetical protein